MKHQIMTLILLGSASLASNAAVVSAAIQGTAASPTITGAVALPDLSYAALIVDGNSNGIANLTATAMIPGTYYGDDNYVAAIFASVNSFFGNAASSPVSSVSWDDALAGSLVANTDDRYYVIWFEGTGGTATDLTQFTPTANQIYWSSTDPTWLVGAPGTTTTPSASPDSGFVSATVVAVPEPSAALLGALGALGLLRRRRN